MFLSVFDMFKVGIGPSSSHTMGPMVAAGLAAAGLCAVMGGSPKQVENAAETSLGGLAVNIPNC